MEIVIIWSWFSFFIGLGAALLAVVLLAFVAAWGQYRKQKKAKDSVDRMFATWGGRDNSQL